MTSEKRNHLRIKPKGLQVDLVFNTEYQEIALEADILDISYSGIRVKLKEPIAADMVGNVKINTRTGRGFCGMGCCCNKYSSGSVNPAVLPVPVCAPARTSRP